MLEQRSDLVKAVFDEGEWGSWMEGSRGWRRVAS